jgi:hypothetical protein
MITQRGAFAALAFMQLALRLTPGTGKLPEE